MGTGKSTSRNTNMPMSARGHSASAKQRSDSQKSKRKLTRHYSYEGGSHTKFQRECCVLKDMAATE